MARGHGFSVAVKQEHLTIQKTHTLPPIGGRPSQRATETRYQSNSARVLLPRQISQRISQSTGCKMGSFYTSSCEAPHLGKWLTVRQVWPFPNITRQEAQEKCTPLPWRRSVAEYLISSRPHESVIIKLTLNQEAESVTS